MSPFLVISVFLGYFMLLLTVSLVTSRDADSQTFFIANKKSPWYLVAFGMVGASLSGITFISIPGEVGNSQFTYFQLVIGYAIAIWIVAFVLLPIYYKLELYSIYEFLEGRFGYRSYKTGAAFFLLAQSVTAAFKLFLMAGVLQLGFFDAIGIPYEVTVFITLLLIWLYTFRSGIKTVIYTDTLQTAFLLLAVVLSVWIVCSQLGFSFTEFWRTAAHDPSTKMFDWDWGSKRNFFKLVFTGMFLTVANNGLDQSVMQKHLTCPNLRDARKNMFWFSVMLLISNYLFLLLGMLLVLFAAQKGIAIPANTDDLYPMLALKHFNPFVGIVFLIGISAAAYSTADSAMTSLTTSICVDFLGFKKKEPARANAIRFGVHFGVALAIFGLIVLFKSINNDTVINSFIQYSGYTYGPLMGLFVLGLFTKRRVRDAWVPFVCVASPILCLILHANSEAWLWGYQFGFEIFFVNTGFTFLVLYLSGRKAEL